MYLIGVDGGGTKTTAVLTNEEGEILAKEIGGASNWRNVGIDNSVDVVFNLIEKIKRDKIIKASLLALSAVNEEEKNQKEYFIKKIKERGLEGEVFLESDQVASFRAGTEEKDGVVVICGTGAVVCGWNKEKTEKASGWGYLADEGSAFFVGIEGYRKIMKQFDKREERGEIQNILEKEWGVKTAEDFNKKVYDDFLKIIPLLSVVIGEAGEAGDETAISILRRSAEEVFLSVKTVTKKLEFKKTFPIVLSGGMFASKTFSSFLSNEITDKIENAEVVFNKKDPVEGAVKLLMEKIKQNNL